ncbi:MAG: hypothetical protein IPK76_06350 [Lewinellaceae bacterium]|jgi:hypothetical protein|nr:hypothetical protein [Lewinellaceae bacterium]
MKNNRKNLQVLTLIFIAAAFSVLASCRKSAEEIAQLFSESEAAEIVETAIADRSAGAAMPTVDMAQIIDSYLNNCGIPGDTTLQKSNSNGVASYAYTFGMEWLITCSNLGVPQSASVDIAGNGTFSTARWAGNDQTTGNLTFTGLSPQEPAYLVNGSYVLEGDVTGDLRRVDPTFHCTTTVSLTGLSISKTTFDITGGSGTVQVAGTNGQGNTRTLNGTLTFNGDGTVTVVINGHTHNFPL